MGGPRVGEVGEKFKCGHNVAIATENRASMNYSKHEAHHGTAPPDPSPHRYRLPGHALNTCIDLLIQLTLYDATI